jgi:carboxymethylenebutenolidase
VRTTLPSGAPAELAVPPGGRAPSLGVALCPDIMGLRPLFDDLCARLAADHGWAVCAVEPWFEREQLSLEERLGAPLREHLVDDLLAAGDVTGCPRTAVMGFCMGGLVAFGAAGLGRFDRAVSFYGMIRVRERWRGGDVVEPLAALAAPEASRTLAIVGGRDIWAPAEDVEALRSAGGDRLEVVVYPEAEHGFVHDAARPAHRADDAADAWRRVVAFLAVEPATEATDQPEPPAVPTG